MAASLKLVQEGKESMDRQKALEAALAQIDRAFGKGSAMKLGSKETMQVETISSGSLGLEALSRGCRDVTFVDQADWASEVIHRNLKSLGLSARAQVIEADVLKTITRFEKRGDRYSLIFVDPPFNQGLVQKTLIKLDQSAIVSPFAQIVVGHAVQEPILEQFKTLELARTKKLGQAYLSFFFKVESQNDETKSYLSGQF